MNKPVDPTELVGEIARGFEAFKETHAEELKGIQSKFDDVVTREKLAKVENSISDLMAQNDELSAKLASVEMAGGVDDGLNEAERQYAADFLNWAKTGDGEQAVKAAQRNLDIRAVASVGTDADGGYAAPIEWDRSITDKLLQAGQMRQYASSQTVSGQGFKRLYNLRGTDSGWVGETDARPETNTSTLGEYTYAFGELYAQPKATQRVLEDPEISMEAWIASEVLETFRVDEATAFLSGDGVNKPKGVLSYDATTEAGLAAADRHPLGPILEVATAASVEVDADDLLNLIYDLPAEREAGAEFFMNRNTISGLRKLKDADGQYLWQRPMQAGEPSSIFGTPIRTLYGLAQPSAGLTFTAGEVPILYGNMAMTYRIFDRIGVSVLRDPFTEKPYVKFYTRKRVGGGLWNPEYMRYLRISV